MTTTATLIGDEQVAIDVRPFKKHKTHVIVSQTLTIDLSNSDVEEEVHSSVLVTEEVAEPLKTFANLFNGNGMEDSISNLSIPKSVFVPISSTATLLLLSIHTLSTLLVGVIPSSPLSQLYHSLTSPPISIPAISIQHPLLQYTTEVTQFFKTPLHLPSFTLESSFVSEKILMPSSSLPAVSIHITARYNL